MVYQQKYWVNYTQYEFLSVHELFMAGFLKIFTNFELIFALLLDIQTKYALCYKITIILKVITIIHKSIGVII